MRGALLIVAAFGLAGCVSAGHGPIQPPPQLLPGCAAVAQDRVRDAAANGYDAVMQTIVYRDAYTACATKEAQSGPQPQPAK